MRTNRAVLVFPLLVGAQWACGASTTYEGGSVSGTVAGSTFVVASALGFDQCPAEDAGSTCLPTGAGIFLTNRADFNTCTSDVLDFANLDLLNLGVGGQNAPLTAGTYDVGAGGATAAFSTMTSTCTGRPNVNATSGSVTLTRVGSARIAGTYDVTFGVQGRFLGAFDVSICPQPPPTQNPIMPPVCR